MDYRLGLTPPITPGIETDVVVVPEYANWGGDMQTSPGGSGGHTSRSPGDSTPMPTWGGSQQRSRGGSRPKQTSGGSNSRSPGDSTPMPTRGGPEQTSPDVMTTQTDVHFDSDVDAARRELESEINAVRSEIRTLSMKRKQRVRADIHRALSDRLSDNSDIISGPNPACQSPRTASVRGGGGRNVDIPATEHQVQASTVVFPSVSNAAGEGRHLGKSEASNFASPAPKTSAGTSGDPENKLPDATPARKAGRKPLKLEKFDGAQTPLETFLAKFHNCQRYNEWSADECAVFLRDSLTGMASQVLWEISPETGHEEIIKLLRNRFGNSNQMERYRAELNARRRKRGESAQSVYQDIKRLMALGFPGQSGEMYEVLSRDAFLSALNDPALRIRVLDQHPKTLDDTLSIVVRMESYSGDNHVDSCDDIVDRKRVRVVSPARESETDKRVRKLEELLERQNQEIERLKGQANNAPCVYPQRDGHNTSWNLGGPPQPSPLVAAPQKVATAVPGSPQQRVPASGVQRGRGSGRRQQNNYRLPRDVCSRCMQRGHWRAQCTSPGYRPSGSGQGGPSVSRRW